LSYRRCWQRRRAANASDARPPQPLSQPGTSCRSSRPSLQHAAAYPNYRSRKARTSLKSCEVALFAGGPGRSPPIPWAAARQRISASGNRHSMIHAPRGHHDFSATQTAVITVSRTVSPFKQPRSASLELSLFPSVQQMAGFGTKLSPHQPIAASPRKRRPVWRKSQRGEAR
jgi:hypothetical protein